MSEATCPKCGHGWGSHQPAPSMGDQCVHTSMGHRCGCTENNPGRVAEDRRARAAWNNFMGRDEWGTQ